MVPLFYKGVYKDGAVMKKKILSLITTLLLTLPSTGWSDRDSESDRDDVKVLAFVGAVEDIQLDSKYIEFPKIEIRHFDQGYIELREAFSLSLWSNTQWALSIKSTERSMGGTAEYSKPISDFQWRMSKLGGYTSVSNRDQIVWTDGRQISDHTIPFDCRVLLDWAKDRPANYTVSLMFTISAQVRQ